MTIREVEYECPFCNSKFNGYIEASYSQFGVNLDFKPCGAMAVPDLLPSCPKCQFVFFDNTFSKNDIENLKTIFETDNIFQKEPNMPKYYYLAKECELVNKNKEQIIYYYHSAIWENENNDLFNKISDIIIEYFDKMDASNKNYYIYKIIKLDFMRRKGKFEEAKNIIKEICGDTNFPSSRENKILIEYQKELIENKDVYEHKWPHENKQERERRQFLDNLFSKTKLGIIFVDKSIKNNVLDELQRITLIKGSKLFNKVKNNLPIMEWSINSIADSIGYRITNSQGEICDPYAKFLGIINILKKYNINSILYIENIKEKINITLNEIDFQEKDESDITFKEKIYKIICEKK